MTDETKRRAIVFIILAALITVMLAVTLPQLQLQQGVPLPGEKTPTGIAPQKTPEPPVKTSVTTFLEMIVGAFLLLVLVFVVARRQQWKRRDWTRLLWVLGVSAVIWILLLYGYSNAQIINAPAPVEILPIDLPVASGPPLAPVPVPLFWVAWVVLAGVVLLLVIGMARARIIHPRIVRDPLAQEAEEAVEALQAGQDFSNVIIRCYQQMSLVLKKEQGLTLEETMTAREFEALLERRGVPGAPVQQLTRLFELARYAAQPPGPADEGLAVDCLNAIARASQKRAAGWQK